MRFFRLPALLGLALTWLATLTAPAMSVLPPTFAELVTEANRIVRGTVVSVSPVPATLADGTQAVKTRVVWKLERALKGGDQDELTLEFLGGEWEGRRMVVPGMPQFAVGDTDYLFLGRNERALCPVIAGDHGRFRVKIDPATGLQRVQHAAPELESLVEGRLASARTGQKRGTLQTVPGFEEAVREQLAEGTQP